VDGRSQSDSRFLAAPARTSLPPCLARLKPGIGPSGNETGAGGACGLDEQQPTTSSDNSHQQAALNAAYSPYCQHAAARFPSLATCLTMRPARDGDCRLHHLAPSSASPSTMRPLLQFRSKNNDAKVPLPRSLSSALSNAQSGSCETLYILDSSSACVSAIRTSSRCSSARLTSSV
jgi:hypothetical protein